MSGAADIFSAYATAAEFRDGRMRPGIEAFLGQAE
jgi:hypothetical protein